MDVREYLKRLTDTADDREARRRALRRVAVLGAGSAGRRTVRTLAARGVEVPFVCDEDPRRHGGHVDGVPVVGLEALDGAAELVVAVTNAAGRALAARLGPERVVDAAALGLDEGHWEPHFGARLVREHADAIEEVYHLLADEASRSVLAALLAHRVDARPGDVPEVPFPERRHPRIRPVVDDTIVEGGAFTGEAVVRTARELGLLCSIHAFEPAAQNHAELVAAIEVARLRGIVTPVRAGLWSSEGTLALRTGGTGPGLFRIEESGDEPVPVVDLDAYARRHELTVDFVTLDVAGAEAEALHGMRWTLSLRAPRLQVACYHWPEDLWMLPLLVHGLAPSARLYLGHHSPSVVGTFLYAG